MALLIAALGGVLALAFGVSADVKKQSRADFEWFSKLGFPDVKGCPYVRVATGWWSQSGEDPPRNKFVPAFLLETNGDNFTVFTLDLFKRQFTQTGPDTAPHQRVEYGILNLGEEAQSELTRVRQPPGKDDRWR